MKNASDHEAGYTLVEMLAALLVLSLAFFGMTTAVRVFSQTARATAVRADQVALGRKLELSLSSLLGPGPYRGSTEFATPALRGDATALTFDCKGGKVCGARLITAPNRLVTTQSGRTRVITLPDGPAAFSYLTADGRTADHFPTASSDRLAGLAVFASGGLLGVVRLDKAQPDDCDFDTATGDCLTRSAATL